MIDTYERNGLTVTIYQDEDPESPREWSNLGTMICSHRNYQLGDEQFKYGDYEDWNDLKDHLINERGAAVVLPLGLYDHSGITMYIGENHDRWDGGQVGFVYVTQEDMEREQGADPTYNLERAEACVRAEVEQYDQYLRGDVYGYSVVNPKTGEIVDDLWGMYGYDYTVEEANKVADDYKHPTYPDPVPYSLFKDMFKVFGVNPYEFKQLSGEKVFGYYPKMEDRVTTINVEKLAEALWGK